MTRKDKYRVILPKTHKKGMRVEGLVFADDELFRQIARDQTVDQIANVATLPGLVGRSLAMPDAHQGYGFCIGGVAASDPDEGVVSAGGGGFGNNCRGRRPTSPPTRTERGPNRQKPPGKTLRETSCASGRKGLP